MAFQQIALPAARIVERLAARRDRDMQRGRHAAAAVRIAGGTAMDATLAHIDATFNESAIHNRLKLNVERTINFGADHPAVRARFGRRVAMLQGCTIAEAVHRVDQKYRAEFKATQIAMAVGQGTRLSVEILAELRLMLRLARRKLTDQQFRIIVAGVLGIYAVAAE